MGRLLRRQRYGNGAAASTACRPRAVVPAGYVSNQALLHRDTAGPAATPPAAALVAAPAAASVDVWGLRVNRSMCGCKAKIRDSMAWTHTAADTYAACNTPANATGAAVEACFTAAQPGSVPVAGTDAGGTITLPPASTDPCQTLDNKASLVHETMHARHEDDLARALGGAFFHAWQALAGDADRLAKMRAKFPSETAAYEARWQNGADWAQDEVHSYTWERRFWESALAALNHIC